MKKKNQLTISEFSRLTGIKRDNLRFYDRIHLLSPEYRGENNYRYYSRHQLNTAFLISELRAVGVSIEEIKNHATCRSANETLRLFDQQDKRIQIEIKKLQETRLLMKMHTSMMKEAMKYDVDACFLENKKSEQIFLCPKIPTHMDCDEGSVFSYDYAEAQGINIGFPQGIIVKQKDIDNRLSLGYGQYYFKVAKGNNAWKTEGLYAIAYGRGDPWDAKDTYERLLHFIKKEGYHMSGDIYEEYPLCDLSVNAIEHYAIRLEVKVTKDVDF